MLWLLIGGIFLVSLVFCIVFFVIGRNPGVEVAASKISDKVKNAQGLSRLSGDELSTKLQSLLENSDYESIDNIIDNIQVFPLEKQTLIKLFASQKSVIERYKDGLADPKFRERAHNVERLGNIGGEGVAEILFQAMSDKNEEVRLVSTAALIKLKDPSVSGLLIDALKHPNKWVPARVAEVLVSFGEGCIPALQEALNDEDPGFKGYIIELLGEMRDKVPVEVFCSLIREDNGNVRLKVARILGEKKSISSLTPLAELLNDPETKVKVQAVRSIGKIGGQEAVKLLVSSLTDGDTAVQYMVLDALKLMGSEGYNIIKTVALTEDHPLADKAKDLLKD